jgi:hypothetical protein
MIFAGIALNEGGGSIGSGPVGSNDFPCQRIFKINNLTLVKLNVTHIITILFNVKSSLS